MKIPLLIPVFLICFTSLCMGTDASVPDVDRISSLERINMADSLAQGSELNPLDINLSSLMNSWYQGAGLDMDSVASELSPDTLSFAIEEHDSVYINRLNRIPSLINLTFNNVVREAIKVYTVKKRNATESILGTKDFYFPIFEEIFDQYGIPLELKYLAVIESGLNPRAVSRVGASGMWQFMLSTGRLYKLDISSFIDQRFDPVTATHAAARFMKDLYNVYNDWTLVLAAYNCGPGNVNKAIRRSGGKTSYWEIYPYLPRETRSYVPLYIAATYALTYFKEHNLTPKYASGPIATDTIILHRDVHFGQVSEVLNLPIEQIRDLNLMYKRDLIPGKSSPAPFYLPVAYTGKFIDMRDSIYNYKPEVFFANKFQVVKPSGSSPSYVGSSAGERVTHTVRKGETLGGIAQKYGVSLSNLRNWNGISGSRINVGQKLTIYGKGSATAEASADGYIYHKVNKGETISKIAGLYGTTTSRILDLNGLTARSIIKPGQTLKIKK
jgi:membrane-bound lytic murein transglycosylase D